MVIKVPIYVELPSQVVQSELPNLVEALSENFHSIVKTKVSGTFDKESQKRIFLLDKLTERPYFKVISRKAALDSLNKGQ
jgi:hypothetical protein